jgi:tRNA G18 (ribose-2'-O)-methylase SpoU
MAAPDYFLAPIKNSTTEETINKLNAIRFPYDIAIASSKNAFNFGAILRTGNSFLVRKYYAIDIDRYYKKAAMTTHKYERHSVIKCSTAEFVENQKGRNIVAFEKRDGVVSVPLPEFVFPENPILMFGNEDDGISPELLSIATHTVSIPMFGTVWDLNVATAAAIAMYSFMTQYKNKNELQSK